MSTKTQPAQPGAKARRAWPAAWPAWLAAVVMVSLAGLAWVYFRANPPATNKVLFQIPLSDKVGQIGFRISPDGRTLALRSLQDGPAKIFVRSMDSLEARPVPGSEGVTYLFWSPDSKSIGFFADAKLKRVSLDGRPPRTLCAAEDPRGGTWSSGGIILFSPGVFTSIFRVPETGGEPARVTKPPGPNTADRYPEFLPDGQHFFYFKAADMAEVNGVYVSSLGDSLNGKEPVRLIGDSTNVAYIPGGGDDKAGASGHWLFRRERALMVQAFDTRLLRPQGGATPVVENLRQGFDNFNWAGFDAVPGVLAYQLRSQAVNSDVVWVDRSGNRSSPILSSVDTPALSPDGKRLAYGQRDPRVSYEDPDFWIRELATGNTVRLTYVGAYGPVWFPDSRHLMYALRSPTLTRFYRILADGGSQPELLGPVGPNLFPYDWSPDGKQLLYRVGPFNSPDLMLMSIEGGQKPVAYKATPFHESDGRFPPDGKWIAYVSNESGENEVYVQAVPITSAKTPVSKGGGAIPRWSPDGKELYYRGRDGKLMAAPVTFGATFEAGPARALFDLDGIAYQPAPDGRFLVALRAKTGELQPLTVVLNWKP